MDTLARARDHVQRFLDLEIEPGRFVVHPERAPDPNRGYDRLEIFDLKHHLYDDEPESDELPEPFAGLSFVDPAIERIGVEVLLADQGYWGPFRFKETVDLDDAAALLVVLIGQFESGEDYTLDHDKWHEGQNWSWDTGDVVR